MMRRALTTLTLAAAAYGYHHQRNLHMTNPVTPTRQDTARGFTFPRGTQNPAHEPTAAVRMNRLGWPPKAIAAELRMDVGKVRSQLQDAPKAERDA